MTQQRLRELFDYHPDGFFIRKKPLRCHPYLSNIVKGHADVVGYKIISIDDKNRKLHRMIFLYHHGFLPRFIDHINHNKSDNRIENLRPATTSQNMANIPKFKVGATSKYKGVSFHKPFGRYIAHIRNNDKLIHLGYFFDEQGAAKAYDEKAKELFGEFACTNF